MNRCASKCSIYATWQVMEEYVPRDLQLQYRKIFNEFDVDGNGVISIENVAEIVSNDSEKYTTESIRSIFRKIINCEQCFTSSQSFVDFPEFLTILSTVRRKCIPEDEMLKIFHMFDQNGDGFIGRDELKSLLSKLGDEISEEEVEEMIREADQDGDGLVSYQEFVRTITNSIDNEKEAKKYHEKRTRSESECSYEFNSYEYESCSSSSSISDTTTTYENHKHSPSVKRHFPWFKRSLTKRQFRHPKFSSLQRTLSQDAARLHEKLIKTKSHMRSHLQFSNSL